MDHAPAPAGRPWDPARAPLARRLRALDVESLAGGARLDTSSWIFVENEPDNWDEMPAIRARGHSGH